MISIYNTNNTDYTKNGNAVLIPTECKLSVQINGSWILSLTHPYDKEERYKLIVKDAVIKVTDINCISENVGTGKNQLFRIYNVTKNDKTGVTATAFPIAMECKYDVPINRVNVVDNGAVLAMEALQNFTNKYTLFCENFGDRHTVQWENTNLAAVLNGGNNSFVKTYGGEIIYNNYSIEVWEHVGNWLQTGVHPVYYGRNILGIDYSVDESGVLTRLFPISSDGIKLNGLGYVDSAKINQYPFIRANFVSAPYSLVDTSEGSDSNTAVLTRSIQTQIQTLASTLSHSVFNSITADRSYEREYIKNVRTEIINAVITNCLSSVSHEKLYNVIAKAINEGMAWMKDIQKSDWSWHENQTGWWYGADGNDYAKNQWCYIDRKWRWFNAEGYWVEKWDDAGDWDWVQSKDSSHWWFGNNQKYYAHDEWVYETVSGELKYYWLNEEGWYEEEYTGVSGWTWHAWGDGWWFGEEGASREDTSKFAHDQWIWIDGTYYFFDSTGYNAPDAKIENYAWDWQEDNQWYWFGNTDKSYGANYLMSQWQKIDGDWWKFDSNGYRLEQSAILSGVNSTFVTGMASLKTLCESLKNDAYTLLYSNMTSYCQKRFTDGLDSPNVTININMIDLAKTQEYSKYSVYEKLCLGDNIECIDYEHGISVEERIVGLTYDCLEQYNTAIIVGKLEGSIADRIGAGGSAEGNVSGGFDTSIIESRIQQNAEGIAALQSGKQDKLTAGQNITIDGNVISATGGGQGLEYWEETSQRFYRNYKVDGISADEGFKKTEWIQEHYSSYTTGEGILYRKKGTAPVIAGEVGDGTLQSDCRRIVMASTNAEDLDWEWAHCNPSSAHLTPTSEWFDKEDYPLVPSQYPAYEFGWQAATITYNNVTWYIMAIQPMYGDGYHHLTNGTLEVKHAGTGAMQMTCAELGQFLLEQVHASDKVDAQVSIGVNDNVFQWIVDGEEVAWINEDGTSSFDDEGTVVDITPTFQSGTKVADYEIDGASGEIYVPLTDVEANPSEEPTDTLESITIGDTVYAIVGGGGGTEKVTSMTLPSADWYKNAEGNMSINWSGSDIVFNWDGGMYIGANIHRTVKIPADAKKIRFKITTGTSYSTTTERFKIGIGLRATDDTGFVYPDSAYTSDWLMLKTYATNNSEWKDELDLSGIQTDTYLYICGHGWNMTITQLDLVEIDSGGGLKNLYTATDTTQPNTITLDDFIENYDEIHIHVKSGTSGRATAGYIYIVDAMASGDIIGGEVASGSGWIWYTYTSNSKNLTKLGQNQGYYISKIVGIKY